VNNESEKGGLNLQRPTNTLNTEGRGKRQLYTLTHIRISRGGGERQTFLIHSNTCWKNIGGGKQVPNLCVHQTQGPSKRPSPQERRRGKTAVGSYRYLRRRGLVWEASSSRKDRLHQGLAQHRCTREFRQIRERVQSVPHKLRPNNSNHVVIASTLFIRGSYQEGTERRGGQTQTLNQMTRRVKIETGV